MRASRAPSFLASAGLHLALFLAAYLSFPFWSKPIPVIESTPVTLVSKAPAQARPALKAEKRQAAAAPLPEPALPPAPAPAPEVAPQPEAPPPEPVAEPRPAPAPRPPRPHPPAPQPKPQPQPRPAPKPAQPAPEPTPKPAPKATFKPAPSRPAETATPRAAPQDLNLDQLAAPAHTRQTRDANAALNLDALASAPSARAPKGSAPQRAAPRPETDLLERLAAGPASALSGSALGALKAKLYRLWNPNCEVEGGAGVVVKVEMRLTDDGRLKGEPTLLNAAGPGVSRGVLDASAQRARSAVRQGEPYTEIPKDGPHDIVLAFDAKQACRR